MTQEDKELLFKDLCARLPYDVTINYHWEIKGTDRIIDVDRKLKFSDVESLKYMLTELQDNRFIIEWKPYLRPMSSMTEEEKRELYNWLIEFDGNWFDFNKLINKLTFDKILIAFDSSWLLCDWLNKKQFDYHGLIPKGLAIEITNENNPYK